MKLGQVPLAQPGNLGMGQPRYLGQENMLSVQVNRDGIAEPGVDVEVIMSDGSLETGVTNEVGAYNLGYGPDAFGLATVLITPPEGVEDMGEDTAQGVDLSGGSASVAFEMHSVAPAASPDATKGLVAGIATMVLLTIFGASI